jgi:hypothetical protein
MKIYRHQKGVATAMRDRLGHDDVAAFPAVAQLIEQGYKSGRRPAGV